MHPHIRPGKNLIVLLLLSQNGMIFSKRLMWLVYSFINGQIDVLAPKRGTSSSSENTADRIVTSLLVGKFSHFQQQALMAYYSFGSLSLQSCVVSAVEMDGFQNCGDGLADVLVVAGRMMNF